MDVKIGTLHRLSLEENLVGIALGNFQGIDAVEVTEEFSKERVYGWDMILTLNKQIYPSVPAYIYIKIHREGDYQSIEDFKAANAGKRIAEIIVPVNHGLGSVNKSLSKIIGKPVRPIFGKPLFNEVTSPDGKVDILATLAKQVEVTPAKPAEISQRTSLLLEIIKPLIETGEVVSTSIIQRYEINIVEVTLNPETYAKGSNVKQLVAVKSPEHWAQLKPQLRGWNVATVTVKDSRPPEEVIADLKRIFATEIPII